MTKEMNDDQIKALAKKFAGKQKRPTDCTELGSILVNFCKYLSTRYCMVKREKVIGLYRDCEHLIDVYPSMSDGLANKLTTMEQLFGASMFNQNEE